MTWTHEQAHHALVCMAYGTLLPPQPSLNGTAPHQVLREYIEQQRNSASACPAPAVESDDVPAARELAPLVNLAAGIELRKQAVTRREAVKVLQRVIDVERDIQSYTAPHTQKREMAQKFLASARSLALRWRESADMPKLAAQKLDAAQNVVRGA